MYIYIETAEEFYEILTLMLEPIGVFNPSEQYDSPGTMKFPIKMER